MNHSLELKNEVEQLTKLYNETLKQLRTAKDELSFVMKQEIRDYIDSAGNGCTKFLSVVSFNPSEYSDIQINRAYTVALEKISEGFREVNKIKEMQFKACLRADIPLSKCFITTLNRIERAEK